MLVRDGCVPFLLSRWCYYYTYYFSSCYKHDRNGYFTTVSSPFSTIARPHASLCCYGQICGTHVTFPCATAPSGAPAQDPLRPRKGLQGAGSTFGPDAHEAGVSVYEMKHTCGPTAGQSYLNEISKWEKLRGGPVCVILKNFCSKSSSDRGNKALPWK